MLNKITLKNFRRHRDLSVTFGAGMTAIRALNEQGKTTLLEAIAYACSGVKAIRDSLDDVVTWGEPTNTLKVTLEIVVDGVVYEIKRGKSGAEVNYDGGIVTGQTEVTNFVAKLLKMDAGAAARLTLSNQNAIRGALEEGPKATTELIEKLADFDIIDNLIELMQEKLTLGSSSQLDAQLASGQVALDAARAQAVPYDEAAHQTKIMAAHDDHSAAKVALAASEQAETAAQEAFGLVREKAVAREALVRDERRASGAVDLAKSKLGGLPELVEPVNVESQVEALQQSIASTEQAQSLSALYDRVKPFFAPDTGLARYKGTMGDLANDIFQLDTNVSGFRGDVIRHTGEIALLRQKMLAGSCTFCGKDFSGVPEVASKNKVFAGGIAVAELQQAAAQAAVDVGTPKLAELRDIEKRSRAVIHGVSTAMDYVTFVDGSLPPEFSWSGPAVSDTLPSVDDYRRQIRELQDSQRAFDTGSTRRAEALQQLALAEAALNDARVALEASPEVSSQAAQERLDEARRAKGAAGVARETKHQDLDRAEREFLGVKTAYNAACVRVKELEATVSTARTSLTTLEFNNALLKRVRQCRPLISDKLWAIVLAAVSSYFSEIRGDKSKVTKDSDGFKVDGHPITSMSGSTLDALGLAIRVALVRTFLPSAPFLILDEPAAAMDADRTGNMLGFLASCGFQQILLVTHEETSSDVADHIISL